MNVWILYLLLLRATVTSFSGFASLPVIREDLVVKREVLSDTELNVAVAISQISPGPLGLYVVIVGYFVAGVPGAVAGMLALATPALLVIPLLRLVQHGRSDIIRGASVGIVLTSCVLMFTAALQLGQDAVTTPSLLIISIAAFAAVLTGRVPAIVVALLAAVASLVV